MQTQNQMKLAILSGKELGYYNEINVCYVAKFVLEFHTFQRTLSKYDMKHWTCGLVVLGHFMYNNFSSIKKTCLLD